MKLTYYFVRHGETLFNKIGRLQGACDSPLTELGMKEALLTKEILEDIHFDRAYTSTSERAVDTAHIILKDKEVPLVYSKDLKEFDFGTLDGSYIKDILDELNARKKRDDFKDIGGDNLTSVNIRIDRIMRQTVRETKDGDTILIVSHGSYCRYLIRRLFGLDPFDAIKNEKALLPNGGIMKFIYDEDHYEFISADA